MGEAMPTLGRLAHGHGAMNLVRATCIRDVHFYPNQSSTLSNLLILHIFFYQHGF